jgi:hypothetical protein
MRALGGFFLGLGVVLVGVGAFFHYKGKKDYGGYFFFGGLCFFLGTLFS